MTRDRPLIPCEIGPDGRARRRLPCGTSAVMTQAEYATEVEKQRAQVARARSGALNRANKQRSV